jgi:hypothetical protein
VKRATPLLTLALLACTAATSPQTTRAPAPASLAAEKDCGDFLAQASRKPANLDYVGCSHAPDRQGKPLVATYRVAGSHAAAVEAYLVRTVKLNRLKRACCQWDSPASQFRDRKGREYSITMGSGETLVSRRADWAKIPSFEVTVETFTEEI